MKVIYSAEMLIASQVRQRNLRNIPAGHHRRGPLAPRHRAEHIPIRRHRNLRSSLPGDHRMCVLQTSITFIKINQCNVIIIG